MVFCKVEDSWKALEFNVLSHRDSKDVFILGGTDDIQVCCYFFFFLTAFFTLSYSIQIHDNN